MWSSTFVSNPGIPVKKYKTKQGPRKWHDAIREDTLYKNINFQQRIIPAKWVKETAEIFIGWIVDTKWTHDQMVENEERAGKSQRRKQKNDLEASKTKEGN